MAIFLNKTIWRGILRLMFLAVAAGSVVGTSAYGQGGSNYSIFGIGDITESVGAAYDGMGITAVAVRSPYAINSINPAAWSYVKTTRLQTGYNFRQAHIESSAATTDQNSGKLHGISALFAVDTALGISVGFGLEAYSTVNYLFTDLQTSTIDGEEFFALNEHAGKGGLSVAHLGISSKIGDDLALAVSGLFYFGNITSTITTALTSNARVLSDSREEDRMNGGGVRFGAMYTGLGNFTLGAAVTANSSLSVENELALGSSRVLNPQDIGGVTGLVADIDTTEIDVDLPLEVAFGASYRTGKFMLNADFVTKDFSSFMYRPINGLAEFRRSNRYSVGVSRMANVNPDADYLDKWAYNFGAGYHQQYLRIAGEDIDETYVTVGVQAPITNSAYIDVAVIGGIRGTTNSNLLKETFFRLSFSVSIGETWFMPFKRE